MKGWTLQREARRRDIHCRAGERSFSECVGTENFRLKVVVIPMCQSNHAVDVSAST